MRKLIIALMMLAVPVCSAVADGVPKYDPDAYCKGVAEATGNFSAMLFAGCLRNEQQAYDALKARWDGLPSEMRQHCHGVASVMGQPSYWLLRGCVENEMAAQHAKPIFKF